MQIKKQLGNKVYYYYFPLFGAYRLPYSRKYICHFQPECRAIISTHWDQLNITLLTPEGVQGLCVQNLDSYQKYLPIIMINEIEKSLLLTEGLKWKHQKQMIRILNFETMKNYTLPIVEKVYNDNFYELSKSLYEDKNQVLQVVKLGRKMQSEIAVKQFFCDNIAEKNINGKPVAAQLSAFVEDSKRASYIKFLQTKEERELYYRGKEIKRILKQSVLERYNQVINDQNLLNKYNLTDNLILDYINQQNLPKQEIKKIPKHKLIDLDEVVDQSMGMYIAALDNAGVFFGNLMFTIARYKDSIKIIKQEIDEIFPEFNALQSPQQDFQPQLRVEKLNKLEKTTLFIKESLRLYNSSPGMFPRIAIKENIIDGIKVPLNGIIQISWNSYTMNPNYFQNPHMFDFSRYKAPSQQNKYLTPFSLGRRGCIGENMSMFEIKMLFVMYVKYFDIEQNTDVYPDFQQCGLTINPVEENLVLIRKKPQYLFKSNFKGIQIDQSNEKINDQQKIYNENTILPESEFLQKPVQTDDDIFDEDENQQD
ncbi:Cytochrome P450 [Pseudocohnilembus persalinus]|uniref:Cytochrome P450 n=1 Tax=Pseudocohnilembus persalinus TaxID=266149 RepID=A0A0V0QR37_PSEPJ|nr:Cytochrome P450 [Pseudocohnilembus persalinus]|eukprot:KRX04731.1 Cytochrome P450 [Pseudocohnilembus persalinus]